MARESSLDDLELYLLEVMEGRRRGLGPELLRAVATAGSWLFAAGAGLRRTLYARGILKRHRAPLPVISVGNLTVGGAGKTPFAAYLAGGLAARNRPVALVARGYRSGGGPDRINDEMEMLGRQAPGLIRVANPNRLAACLRAAERGAEVAVLDDGFQHLALHRDLDILLFDAARPFGSGRLLPRGTLREPPECAARADLAVFTRVDQAGLGPVGELRTWLGRLRPGLPIVECCFRPSGLRALTESAGSDGPAEALQGRAVGAFAALADPVPFGRTLRGLGARVVYSRRFRDHHRYTAGNLAAIAAEAAEAGAQMLVTTEKDAVKLESLSEPSLPLHCLSIETEICDGEDLLWAEVSRAMSEFKPD